MTGRIGMRGFWSLVCPGLVLMLAVVMSPRAEACPPIEVIDTEPNTPVEWQWGDPTVLTVTVPERGEVRDSRATHPVVGQTYSASDDTRQDARAWSTLSVSRFGGAILAEMRQRVSLLDANSPAAGATGVAYLHIRAARDPNNPNVAWMRVWKHQTITATPGIGGTYSIDGGAATALPDEAVRLTSYRDIEVDFGSGLTADLVLEPIQATVSLEGRGTSGDAIVETTISVEPTDCVTDEPPPDGDGTSGGPPLEPPICPTGPTPDALVDGIDGFGGPNFGSGLHLNIMNGQVWTQVPIFESYDRGERDLWLTLTYNSGRGCIEAFGQGWSAGLVTPHLEFKYHSVGCPAGTILMLKEIVYVAGTGHRIVIPTDDCGNGSTGQPVLVSTSNVTSVGGTCQIRVAFANGITETFSATYPLGCPETFFTNCGFTYCNFGQQGPIARARIVSRSDASGRSWSFLATNDRIYCVTSSSGHSCSFTYDENGLITRIDHPDSSSHTSLTYDPGLFTSFMSVAANQGRSAA